MMESTTTPCRFDWSVGALILIALFVAPMVNAQALAGSQPVTEFGGASRLQPERVLLLYSSQSAVSTAIKEAYPFAAGSGVEAFNPSFSVEPPAPDLTFKQASLDFGGVKAGTSSAPLTATLHDTGDVAATGLDLVDRGVSETTICGITERVSVASDGTEANVSTLWTSISADGRFAVFSSPAFNLVPGDTNGTFDVFVHDRDGGTTERVSVTSDGTEANGLSDVMAISADGRYVAFRSFASNLVPGDTNGAFDVFLHDRDTGVTERVSVASDGTEGNSIAVGVAISADGRYVAFASDASNLVAGDTNDARDVFLHDRQTGTTERVSVTSDNSQGNGASEDPAISADGRYVSFESVATNLVEGDTNTVNDIFVHDTETGVTERISVASDGTQGNLASADTSAISVDGRYVAFGSFASNLVPNDTNGTPDIFVRDRQDGVTERVSVASDGSEADDGSFPFAGLAISADGRSVVFISQATNLVPDDSNGGQDVFVRDRSMGTTVRASVAFDCTEGNGPVAGAQPGVGLSADGRSVAFVGTATNLVPKDTNDAWDAFVHTFPSGLVFTPDALDFGPVLVDTTRGPLSLTVTNVGTEEVTVSEISEPEAPFAAAVGTCDPAPFVLAPEESCTLSYSFSPTGAGAVMDTVTLTGDAPNSPHGVELRGLGSPVAMHIAPSFLAFGGVVIGDTAGPLTETLTNAGDVPIEVDAVSTPAAPFAASGGTCGPPPFGLDPYASCTLDYVCSPTEEGVFAEQVEVTSDAPNSPAAFGMRCRGLTRELTVTPELLDFGDVPVGDTSGPLDVTLTNSGQADVTLSRVSHPGPPFVLAEDTCDTVLPPMTSCTLSYAFEPTTPGADSATLTIRHDAPSSPNTVDLQGTGLGAAIEVDPESLVVTLDPGGTDTRPLTLTNTGNETLEWEVTENPDIDGGPDSTGTIRRPARIVTAPLVSAPPGGITGFVPDSGTANGELMRKLAPQRFGDTTLTHSESLEIHAGNSIACSPDDGDTTSENHFLRTFTLTDFDIPGAFNVAEVTFGVEGLNTRTPITVNLYTLEGELVFENLTLIGTTTQQTPAQTLTLVTVPLTGTAPAGSTLVVEVHVPDLSGVAAFFPGSNDLGETAPSYIAASGCGADEPTTFADIGFPNVHLVMSVTGTAGEPLDCTLPSWADVDPSSGSVRAGQSRVVDVTFDATDLDPGVHEAKLCIGSNDPIRPLITVPLVLTVNGVTAELTFAPASLDFGAIEVGSTSPPLAAVLENTGDLDVTGLTFSDPSGSGFDVDTAACGTTLAVGQSCDVSVTFTPAQAGPVSVALQVTSDQGASDELGLAGQGVTVTPELTPTALEVDPEPFLSDGNRVFEPGELVAVAPAWRNDGPDVLSLTGDATNFDGPEGALYFFAFGDASYGDVEPGQTASCLDTGVCYFLGVTDPAVRPAMHWEASFEETLSDGTGKSWDLHIGNSFSDAPATSPFYSFVETLLHSGVTSGCSATTYCPTGVNTRSQMAVFVLRALEGSDFEPQPCVEGEEPFADVPAASPFCPWIQELASRQVVAGCGEELYCPDTPVTRAQMAVFLLKTLEGPDFTPPECTGTFSDVPCSTPLARWIEELFHRGVTAGCSSEPLAYCPATPVSRQQMAAFLSKTFGLTLYKP